MKIVALPRARGKTTELLNWLRDAPDDEIRILVSHSANEAMRVYRDTMEQNGDGLPVSEFESWQFVSLREVLNDGHFFLAGVRYDRPRARIVFGLDNLDLMLAELLRGFPVGALSLTVA